MQHPPVQTDLAVMRIRAPVDEGAVTAGYTADRKSCSRCWQGHADALADLLAAIPS
ncbi:MAG: hypothetical protein KBF50_12090 [Steroidobacteraceae bacterium]|nr:hypothetical protein [Steroidobacteraceae bacterium]